MEHFYKEEAELAVKWYEVNDIPAYIDTDEISVYVIFNDMTFLECISHHEIDKIKENLKKRIDNL